MYKVHGKDFPTPHQLAHNQPINQGQIDFITRSRKTIEKILDGQDTRLLLILGPCSIHDKASAMDYAKKLQKLAASVESHFFIVMRFYIEKARTSIGWKGLLYDPDLDGSQDIIQGLTLTRELLLELAQLKVPAAAELLEPLFIPYYNQLLSWGCIGARTAESQPHRMIASGQPMPIGIKNPTSGSIESAVSGVVVASHSHLAPQINEHGKVDLIKTPGNPYAHVVLRGGESAANYDAASIDYTVQCLQRHNLPSRLVIDCSHDNSRRNHLNQTSIFKSSLKNYAEGNEHIRGLILESHLYGGNQRKTADPLKYAVSITDPCLDWEMTVQLVEEGKQILQSAALTAPLQTQV